LAFSIADKTMIDEVVVWKLNQACLKIL